MERVTFFERNVLSVRKNLQKGLSWRFARQRPFQVEHRANDLGATPLKSAKLYLSTVQLYGLKKMQILTSRQVLQFKRKDELASSAVLRDIILLLKSCCWFFPSLGKSLHDISEKFRIPKANAMSPSKEKNMWSHFSVIFFFFGGGVFYRDV